MSLTFWSSATGEGAARARVANRTTKEVVKYMVVVKRMVLDWRVEVEVSSEDSKYG